MPQGDVVEENIIAGRKRRGLDQARSRRQVIVFEPVFLRPACAEAVLDDASASRQPDDVPAGRHRRKRDGLRLVSHQEGDISGRPAGRLENRDLHIKRRARIEVRAACREDLLQRNIPGDLQGRRSRVAFEVAIIHRRVDFQVVDRSAGNRPVGDFRRR